MRRSTLRNSCVPLPEDLSNKAEMNGMVEVSKAGAGKTWFSRPLTVLCRIGRSAKGMYGLIKIGRDYGEAKAA